MVTWVEPKNRYQLFWLGFKWNPCTVLLLKPGKIKELYKSTYNIYIYIRMYTPSWHKWLGRLTAADLDNHRQCRFVTAP